MACMFLRTCYHRKVFMPLRCLHGKKGTWFEKCTTTITHSQTTQAAELEVLSRPWHLNRFKPPGDIIELSQQNIIHTHCIYIYIHNVCPSHHQMIPRHGGPTSLWPNFSSRPFWSPGSWVRSGGCRVILPPSKWRIVPNGSHLKKLRLT